MVPLSRCRIVATALLTLILAGRLPAQGVADTTHVIVNGPIGARADSTLTHLQGLGFSGVALVAKAGHVILKKGYGLANRAAGVPMTGNSVVQIGSNTKDFTAVAILQLLERGRLSLDDSLPTYFANVPADKRGITVRELLLHRAGFGQHLGDDWAVMSRDQEVAGALSAPLLFAPGTARAYSNVGYSLLAAIIETVSGGSYDAYVRDNILNPLGLRETGLLLPQFDPARVAHGYRNGQDAGTFLERPHAVDGPYWNLRGNGGMLSTVSDMYRFYRSLLNDSLLLKPATRDILFHANEPIVLAGSDLTFFFFYSRFPIAGFDVILVSNATDYPAPSARAELEGAIGVAPPPGGRAGGRGNEIAIDTGPPPGGRRGGIGDSGPGTSVAIPDTPVGRAARQYLSILQTADTATIRHFLEEGVVQGPNDHRTMPERVATIRMLHDDLGALTPAAIQSSTDDELVIRMRSTDGSVATFTFTVEQHAPYRITGVRVERE